MSSELEKFLAKVSPKEKKLLGKIIEKIITRNFIDLDLKKLTGQENIFRIRKGVFRIIFKITKAGVKIITITRRNDTIYNV